MIGTIILRRILMTVPTLLGIAILVFVLGHLTPGDPAIAALGLSADGYSSVSPELLERVRQDLGLNDPLPIQFANWMLRAVQGDFGMSYVSSVDVSELIFKALPTTLALITLTMTVAATLGITLGLVSAAYAGRVSDLIARLVTIVGVSTPVFWLALVLLLAFAYHTPIFPINGSIEKHGLIALVLPAAAIALNPAALIARIMRTSMLDVLSQDFIRTARSKGVPRRRILSVHAFRNAVNPVVTVIGFQFANLMGSAVAVEAIFSLNGLGKLLVDAIYNKDILVLQGAVLVISVAFALTNLLVDIAYTIIDPRIRL